MQDNYTSSELRFYLYNLYRFSEQLEEAKNFQNFFNILQKIRIYNTMDGILL